VAGLDGFRELKGLRLDGGDLGVELMEGRRKPTVTVDDVDGRLAVGEAGAFSDVREASWLTLCKAVSSTSKHLVMN
jgi:hypothetical protein